MADFVRITDVAARDGLQNEPGVASAQDKIRLLCALADAGVDEIEATSFVSPKWVPQMGDAAHVLQETRKALRNRAQRPAICVLTPNKRGFDDALPFHDAEWPLKIAVFTAASETFNRKNTNASIAESIDRFREFVPEALDHGMPVRMYVSCVVACPFEGAIDPAQVRRACDLLIALAPDAYDAGLTELDLGDTIGVAHPEEIERLLDQFTDAERARLVLHLHDTHGRAADCVDAALAMGVRSFDGAVSGLGGCPYASTPTSRAPGNLATETLVATVHDAGYRTHVDPARLRQAGKIAQSIVADLRAEAAT